MMATKRVTVKPRKVSVKPPKLTTRSIGVAEPRWDELPRPAKPGKGKGRKLPPMPPGEYRL